MKKISAVVDAQGFYKNGNFLIRELAFISDKWCVCFEVDTELDVKSLSASDIVTNNWCSTYHGLSLRPEIKLISQDDAIAVIRQLSYSLGNEKPIGVKNNQLKEILDRMLIHCVEIDCPSAFKMDIYYPQDTCKFHENHKSCALRKVKNIWRFLNEQNHVEKLINQKLS